MPDELSLIKAAIECYLNTQSLHKEARLLARHGYGPRAAALAVIGVEEFAKSIAYALAALSPEKRDLLGKGLSDHETKHLVAAAAEAAEIETHDYRVVIAQESGWPLSHRDALVVLFQQMVGYDLENLVRNPKEAKEFYRRLGKDLHAILPDPYLKNAALYVDLDNSGDVLIPARIEHQVESAIRGLEWFLRVYCALPEVLQNQEEWNDFRLRIMDH